MMSEGMGRKVTALVVILSLMAVGTVRAQSIDPTLAAMIALYTEKAENTLEAQEKVMLLESTGHVWIKEEVEGTYELQKEFNEYLDTFRGILVFAAQIYGFYHEIDRMIGNMDALTQQISKSPGNAVAVALSANRNKIYREIILQSVEIVNDVRLVCLNGSKMTEKERIGILFGIRPKLNLFNKKLVRLAKAVKYTSLGDVWREITGREIDGADKGEISRAAFQRWKSLGRSVRP